MITVIPQHTHTVPVTGFRLQALGHELHALLLQKRSYAVGSGYKNAGG